MTQTPHWALERIREVKETRLEELDLDGSLQEELLFEIPVEVSQLYWLRSLNLSNNQLTNISTEIFDLESLVNINLTNNPIEIPPEIIDKGIESMKEYLKQMEESKTDYLYEAKLLVVGEGGSGKTSLVAKILNFENELKADEYSTSGISISPWYFSLENGEKLRVNIWDFGGQEIYHATHQLFLTKHSLYLLVADTRREYSDFYYWLNLIELYGDNSPVLIIKNEKQDRSKEINERQLRGQFSNLKATLTTNLATNRGLPEVIEQVKDCIKNLPYTGIPLPKIWVNIREALERESRSYITLDDYINICCEHGLTQQKDQAQLSSYFHDLGIVLHFQDDPILRKFLILEPTWATNAIYQVIDSYAVRENLGIFNHSDLTSIWSNQEYHVRQDELLQLMLNFKLCYKIPGKPETYIVPQHLTLEQPEYEWDEADNLILCYEYEFMPKGILTQFIIALHNLILEQQYVWRSGVILSLGQAKAEVIEYYHRREIAIRVLGESKHDLLSTITHELDKVNSSYARLNYKKLIPCNCNVCRDSASPQFYVFDSLLDSQKFYLDPGLDLGRQG
jgi:GTPase SAR1 family protein